jgi:hypothetical protein
MVTKVALRFERDLKLPVRPRSQEANQFILNHLEELRRQLLKPRGRQKMSCEEGRYVK